MLKEMICAGFGGQGVLTVGMIFITAAMEQDKNVIYYPSYGSEMRGGTANCTVKISDKLISSPVSKNPDIVLTMNAPAIDKFESRIKPGGLLLVNTSIVDENRKYRDDIKVIKVAATDLAIEAGNPKGANIVMLGALAANTDIFDLDYMENAMIDFFDKKGKGKFKEKNIACFRSGATGR